MAFDPAAPRLERLFRATVETGVPLSVGVGPLGERRIIPITGGRFEGERLSGDVLPGGADWQLVRPARGEAVDPQSYYFRTTPQFETGALKYAWLNDLVAVCSAARAAGAVTLDFYAVR